jgi:hypothetical protein
MAIEIRETYYEIYLDGELYHEGSFEACKEYALRALDDDLAEVYKVTVIEEKIIV